MPRRPLRSRAASAQRRRRSAGTRRRRRVRRHGASRSGRRPPRSPRRAHLIDGGGILERREIAELRLAEVGTADDAAEDLRVPRFRQLRDEPDALGLQRLAKVLDDRVRDRSRELIRRGVAGPQDREDHDRLALQLVGDPDGRGLGHRGMRDRGRLDLGGTDALARDLQRVVAAALYVPIALVVDAGPVAVVPDAVSTAPVGVQVATLVGIVAVVPEAAGHAGPGLPDDELADLAAHGARLVVDDVRVHAGTGAAERAGLDRRPGRAADDAAGDLGPAGVIDDRATGFADGAEVPPPRVGVPRLTGGAEHEEARAVVLRDRLFARAHEPADRGR